MMGDLPGGAQAEPVWHRVADACALDTAATVGRLHTCVQGRYVSVIRHQGQLHCLDSVCFHAGGPLALGEIEELGGEGGAACLICPWHYYRVSLRDGEKWYQAADQGKDGKYHAGQWKSVGQRQRLHEVELRPDGGLWVRLNLAGEVASDEYACRAECGTRVKSGSLRLSHGHGDRDGSRSPSRSPNRPASPLRGLTPPASPRAAIMMEGEDVWPEDLSLDRRTSNKRRASSLGPQAE